MQKMITCIMLVFWLAYSSTLKMEATCSYKRSVGSQRAARRHIPEDSAFLYIGYYPILS
jgi:hypothetical protein